MSQLLYKTFIEEAEYGRLIIDIYNALPDDHIFSNEMNNYSQTLDILSQQTIAEFINNEAIQGLIEQYITAVLRRYLASENDDKLVNEKQRELREYIGMLSELNTGTKESLINSLFNKECLGENEFNIFVRFIMADINCELQYLLCNNVGTLCVKGQSKSAISQIGCRVLSEKSLSVHQRNIVSAYYEAFADIQMILLTGIGYEGYLRGFLNEEKLDLKNLSKNLEDISRFAMVTFVLNEIDVWDIYGKAKEFNEGSCLKEFHDIIDETIGILKSTVDENHMEQLFENLRMEAKTFSEKVDDDYAYREISHKGMDVSEKARKDNISAMVNLQLVRYLKKCLEESLAHYSTRQNIEKIKELRKSIRGIVKYKNIYEMFDMVCKELDGYKEKLFETCKSEE